MPRDYQVDVVQKALAVLLLFDYRVPRWTLDGVARAIGVSRSRAYRILQTLAASEFVVAEDDRRHYQLGPAAKRLGLIARTGSRFTATLQDAMHELHRTYEETVNLAWLDGRVLRYVDILPSPHPFRLSENIGDIVPLTTTALGRAVLAAVESGPELITREEWDKVRHAIDQTRQLGYAVDDQDTVPGARCVGVAIRDPAGTVLGALSVSGPAARMDARRVMAIGSDLIVLARQIQRAAAEMPVGLSQPS